MSSVTDLTNAGTLKNLRLTGKAGFPSLSKLGKKINTTGAAPFVPKTGLLVSANFNGHLGSMAQAVENTEYANSLFLLAKSGVQSILEHINNIYSVVKESLPLDGSSAESDILNSNQASINESINSINTIAESTKLNNMSVLNGAFAFNISDISAGIEDVRLFGITLKDGYPMDVDVIVTAAPQKARTGSYIAGVQQQESEIRLTGEFGSQTLNIPAYSTKEQVETIINNVKKLTGVEAEDGRLQSVFYGSKAFVRIEELSGNFEGISPGTYYGADIEGDIHSHQANGARNTLSVKSEDVNAFIAMDPESGAGTYGFNVSGGLRFQSGTKNMPANRLLTGINPLNAEELGDKGGAGTLSSLLSGSTNDIFNNPVAALEIAEKAKAGIEALYEQMQSLEYALSETNFNQIRDSLNELIEEGGAIKDGNIANNITKSLRQGMMKNSLALTYKDTILSYRSVLKLLT